jgi:hypothetical protein
MVRHLLALALLCVALLFGGEAKANCTTPCTKAQIATDIATNWPDNTTGAITPALLRSTVLDLVNSYLDANGASTFSCPGSNWISTIATLSTYTCTQPGVNDISGFGTGVATALALATNTGGGFPTTNGTATLSNKTFDTAAPNTLKIGGVTVSAGQYPGTATNDNATAGNIGEYVESVIASGSAVSLTTATAADITTISLTAGDWDVSTNCSFITAATTSVTEVACSVSTTLNTTDATNGRLSILFMAAVVPTAGTTMSSAVQPVRFSLSGTTTIHMVALARFTVSTMTGYGIIRARRIR